MAILPSGYKRLLYIESTGTQWIDTKFIPNVGDTAFVDFQFTEYVSDTWAVSVLEDANNRWTCGVWQNAFYLTGFTASQTANLTGRTTFTGTCQINASRTLTIFAQNMSSGAYGFGIGRLFACKIYDNGTLARNYIPCENASGIVGLYDTVNQTFYGNSGTGVFIAGPEWGYTELEYIESTGTQYIDTVFIPNQDTRICMDVIPKAVNTETVGAYFFGSGYPVQQNGIESYAYSGVFCGAYNGGQVNGSIAINAGDRLNIDFNKNVYKVTRDGVSVYSNTFTYAAYTSPINLHLLVLPRQSKFYGSCKLYSCKIYDNDELARDYIPARLSDGSVGLLDKLTEEFYPNMGTGEFIAGPEVVVITTRKITVTFGDVDFNNKTDDFAIKYKVIDDLETESFNVVEYIDGNQTDTFEVAAGDIISTTIKSTELEDGTHSFTVIVDEVVEAEYIFIVDNTTATVTFITQQIELPEYVFTKESFKISVIVSQVSMTYAKLRIQSGDIFAGEV